MASADIHAIVVSRNGAETLDSLLSHLCENAIEATVVDHGSTDETWRIAARRLRTGVSGVIHEPFRGAFDLTRQLAIRSELIRSTQCDWILNLDDDEFLEPVGEAETLRSEIERAHAVGSSVIEAQEFVFAPEHAEARHATDSFRETMRHYVPFQPRNPKQRAFRQDVDLTLWRRTGGHTVSRGEDGIVRGRLNLLHYPGLSMDQVRAKYLSRVFSPRDLSKGWHTNRIGGEADFIQVPRPGQLRLLGADALNPSEPVSVLPFFTSERTVTPTPLGSPDIVVAAPPGGGAKDVAGRLGTAFPGLSVVPVSQGYSGIHDVKCPLVIVLRNPRTISALTDYGSPSVATGQWVRRVCFLKQLSLTRASSTIVRYEDLQHDFRGLCSHLEGLLGVMATELPPPLALDAIGEGVAISRWVAASENNGGPESIAGAVMADLGYGRIGPC